MAPFALALVLSACSSPLSGDSPDDGPEVASIGGPQGTQTLPSEPSGTATTAEARPHKRPKRTPLVVLISVDGLNPDAITQLDAAGRVPAFRRLLTEGAGTLNARTSYEQTNTLPNHTGMLTGRHVDGPLGTNVTFNEDHPGTLESINGHYVPGVFDPVHDAGLATGFFAEKSKFAFLIRSWDGDHGARDRDGADNGRDKVDTSDIGSASSMAAETLAELRSPKSSDGRPLGLVFLHIAAPDHAGHAHGFMSRQYLDGVADADREIGAVLDTISASRSLSRRTTVILTADHGGKGPSHRDPTKLTNYRIPFLTWGARVPAGTDLYDLNPGRRDPGTARIGYEGPQPIRNLDATDLALRLLGLPPLPDTSPGGLVPLETR